MRRFRLTSLICIGLIFYAETLVGCGYSFSGSSLPSHIKSVAIPVLENQSLDYQVADEVTQALVDRFISDNRLKITPISQADAVLE